MRQFVIMLLWLGGLATACALAPLYPRRHVMAAAAIAAVPHPSGAASSLTDAEGRFVVDPQKAANGLLDPLAEPEGAYSTISSALAVAPADATVIVRPGTYAERGLTISRGVRLIADAGAVLDFKAANPNEPALCVDLSGASAPSSVLISGLRIKHFSPYFSQNYGVYVPRPAATADGSTRIELQGCEVSSSSGTGIGVEGGELVLTDCKITSCKYHGVAFVGPTARGAVRRCVIENCKLNGVLLREGASPTLEANRLLGNGQYGAALLDCRGRYLESNQASGNGKGAVSGECDEGD